MDNAQKKLVIITASVLLHAITLFVILVLYHQPDHDLFAVDSSQAIDIAETIFYDREQENSLPNQPPLADDQTWGQLKPRASSLGTSMELPEGAIGPEIPGEISEDENGSDESSDQDTDTESSENSKPIARENSLEFNSQIRISEELFESARPEPIKGSERLDDRSNASTQPSLLRSYGGQAGRLLLSEVEGSAQTEQSEGWGDSDVSKKQVSLPSKALAKDGSRKKARKALAGITQGYLQQLHNEGENLIKTIGGDPNKKPTAEQLKYERYLAKIQWCLQNAHSINQEKCQLKESIDTTMRIYFVLNREGKMTGFKIMQSSGKAYVDQYISSLFQFASSSFPPLPAYVKEDHLPLTYTVLVNWNTGSHMGFSRY